MYDLIGDVHGYASELKSPVGKNRLPGNRWHLAAPRTLASPPNLAGLSRSTGTTSRSCLLATKVRKHD
jgi:hypothetical protein